MVDNILWVFIQSTVCMIDKANFELLYSTFKILYEFDRQFVWDLLCLFGDKQTYGITD